MVLLSMGQNALKLSWGERPQVNLSGSFDQPQLILKRLYPSALIVYLRLFLFVFDSSLSCC